MGARATVWTQSVVAFRGCHGLGFTTASPLSSSRLRAWASGSWVILFSLQVERQGLRAGVLDADTETILMQLQSVLAHTLLCHHTACALLGGPFDLVSLLSIP